MRYFCILCVALLLVSCAPNASNNTSKQSLTNIEFRLAELSPQAGFTDMLVKSSQQKVYVSETVILSRLDIASAESIFSEEGMPLVGFKMTKAGTQKLADATARFLNKPIAVIINGELLTAPIVREQITGGMMAISGFSTLQEAKDVVDGFNKK